jgi:GT2 family glycosyltransferase
MLIDFVSLFTRLMPGLINVLIVNWNGRAFLSKCLDGLRSQVYPSLCVTVVDNGSDDRSVDFIARDFPEVKIIELSGNLGFSRANNIALENVDAEYVALLNNDAIPRPSWLGGLVEALESHPEAGFAASKMVFYNNHGIIDRAGDVYTRAGTGLLRGRGKPSGSYDKQEYVFGACAGAALYRTEMLREVGLFDEDFFILYEDVDLSFRAQLRGYKCIYVPDAVVYHVGSGSIGEDTPTSVYYSHRNLEWVYLKNMPAGLIRRTIVGHLIYDLASMFFFMAKGRGGDYLRAKWHALKGMRTALRKRGEIQKSKKVPDSYIWSLLEKERFLPRLTRRLAKHSA